jgi:hypothetical protein
MSDSEEEEEHPRYHDGPTRDEVRRRVMAGGSYAHMVRIYHVAQGEPMAAIDARLNACIVHFLNAPLQDHVRRAALQLHARLMNENNHHYAQHVPMETFCAVVNEFERTDIFCTYAGRQLIAMLDNGLDDEDNDDLFAYQVVSVLRYMAARCYDWLGHNRLSAVVVPHVVSAGLADRNEDIIQRDQAREERDGDDDDSDD